MLPSEILQHDLEKIKRHLKWIEAIKSSKKMSDVLDVVEEIRQEGYEEARLRAAETREKAHIASIHCDGRD